VAKATGLFLVQRWYDLRCSSCRSWKNAIGRRSTKFVGATATLSGNVFCMTTCFSLLLIVFNKLIMDCIINTWLCNDRWLGTSWAVENGVDRIEIRTESNVPIGYPGWPKHFIAWPSSARLFHLLVTRVMHCTQTPNGL